jgi:hypothetical protein
VSKIRAANPNLNRQGEIGALPIFTSSFPSPACKWQSFYFFVLHCAAFKVNLALYLMERKDGEKGGRKKNDYMFIFVAAVIQARQPIYILASVFPAVRDCNASPTVYTIVQTAICISGASSGTSLILKYVRAHIPYITSISYSRPTNLLLY